MISGLRFVKNTSNKLSVSSSMRNVKMMKNNGIQRRQYSGGAALNKADVTDRVLNVVKNFHKVDGTMNVKPETHFANDLGLDSLDNVEVVMAFEDEFAVEIPDEDAEKIGSCNDAINYILSNPHAK
eukprot:TRINITY_DN5443_c0_g1_i1.p1 TRINITY_DN5443_c0_g1~~TRINITY_DN5443_c0_g1_i1.p1  ORF type:complete len:126 (+),score=53.19 TRINITY_DN5443_c0_g1_i1:140-517(+)